VTQKSIEKFFTPSGGWLLLPVIHYKDSTPLGVSPNKHFTFRRKSFSPLAHFQWRKNGKNAVVLSDGIGLGMLSKGHPIKRVIF